MTRLRPALFFALLASLGHLLHQPPHHSIIAILSVIPALLVFLAPGLKEKITENKSQDDSADSAYTSELPDISQHDLHTPY